MKILSQFKRTETQKHISHMLMRISGMTCRELESHSLQLLCPHRNSIPTPTPDFRPSCILCPVNWQWIGGDTCFYISTEKRSWKKSQEFCSSQNSTLLMIKDTEKLKLVCPYFMVFIFYVHVIFLKSPETRKCILVRNITLQDIIEEIGGTNLLNLAVVMRHALETTIYPFHEEGVDNCSNGNC
uniref:C-type lectin domain-containing protein n=1 Tax=Pelusios castaneus TaxID=367368 RepID=A0A8C8S2W5_9SAUR